MYLKQNTFTWQSQLTNISPKTIKRVTPVAHFVSSKI